MCTLKKIQLIKCNINKIIYKIYLNRYFIKKICIFRRNLFNINKIIYKKTKYYHVFLTDILSKFYNM